MDYPYENLSPEKFQLFCQALLAKEYPNLQCLPVGQPDGGRDMLQYWHYSREGGTVVFQVKFIRRPQLEQDAHQKIVQAVEGEIPKIKKLLKYDVRQYVMVTNVAGTAHLDVGSIDLVSKMLESELQIQAVCMWRNDLNRKLDSAWDLKWAYPELMTGPDLIRTIVESGLSEERERRSNALRAFIAHQYSLDEEVKFKQVDLQNRILDLFIDVPISRKSTIERQYDRSYYSSTRRPELFEDYDTSVAIDMGEDDSDVIHSTYTPQQWQRRTGAANFFLNSGSSTPLIVLEGAPGQGKSTITQYLCQVHRMRILNKTVELNQIVPEHRLSSIRVPFKVDLRDFAIWIERLNPFSPEAEKIEDAQWSKSLESFLAALIKQQSGGAEFSVADLHALFRLSAVLVVLDGLDEVAEIKRRNDVVSEISKGIERLRPIAASLQVIVTSRPTAFANSPGLPEKLFTHLTLESVTPELIDEYANKWVKARKLQGRESFEVKRILREKLDQPHMRDLARNPMQLAILLSLIHTQGSSLPDKRTALYDSYVRLFFNREAEKSEIVRDKRELLLDIHRYLAWLLHTEAEQVNARALGRGNGAIEEKRLKQILAEYLNKEGYSDPELPGKLFSGVVERVVALVSRVQGTYEFEVQPLREYFAARFLYETAPYSPVGDERSGTKPDRFDAIAKNFYWLNVTRFYAGCYSKGELASLIDCLKDLTDDPDFKLLSHPRVLAATLLSDWVFTQHPKSVSEVIKLMLDGVGLRFLLTSNSRRLNNSQPLALPQTCGRSELVGKCFEILSGHPPSDYSLDVMDLLRSNSSRDELLKCWRPAVEKVTGDDRTTWLGYGVNLGCVSNTQSDELIALISDIPLNRARTDILLRARKSEVLESSVEYFRSARECLLDRTVSVAPNWRQQKLIDAFGQALDGDRYALAFRFGDQGPLNEKWKSIGSRAYSSLPINFESGPVFPEAKDCLEIVRLSSQIVKLDTKAWATSLSPWDSLLSKLVELFGERWAAVHLANIGSGIKSSSETCIDSADLFDASKPLSRRARYARLRAGSPMWWKETFDSADKPEKVMFALLAWFTWASSNNVIQQIESVDGLLTSLTDERWHMLFDSVENAIQLTGVQSGNRLMDIPSAKIPSSLSPRALSLLKLRVKPMACDDVFFKGFNSYGGKDSRILKMCQNDAVDRLVRSADRWASSLDILSKTYVGGVISERYSAVAFSRYGSAQAIPLEIAIKIANNADSYPSFVVAAAEVRCRVGMLKKVRPVAKVASEEKWLE